MGLRSVLLLLSSVALTPAVTSSLGVRDIGDGKEFKEVTSKADSNVVIVVYTPWSGHWKRFAPHFDAVARGFAGVRSRTDHCLHSA